MEIPKKGVINAIIAYSLWGVYPLYWALLMNVRPFEIMINRMIWSFVTLLIFILCLRLTKPLKKTIRELIKERKKLFFLIVASFLLGLNWFIYTFAVVTGRVLEGSLGYYINPLINVLIGVVFLKEKLNKYQGIAVLIAFGGVLFLTISYGSLPWISLVLAISFGLYGVVKKFTKMEATFSLFLETSVMIPVSAFFFTFWLVDGSSAFLHPGWLQGFVLAGAGIITMAPLHFFAKAARQLPLSILGFAQYIAPTLQMIVAVLFLGESFSSERLIAFCIIWIACSLFSMSSVLERRSIQSR